jgi:predicted PurR-regulated permease PerM
MVLFTQRQQRAQIVIALLGIGLVITLWPYSTGLIGGPVLYVVFDPLNRWLRRWLAPGVAAILVVAIATFLLLVPGASIAGLAVNQAQQMAGGLINSPLIGRLADLRIADIDVGPRLIALGENAVAWIGSSAFDLLGTATKLALNLTIAMFALYYLLVRGDEAWAAVSPYIPFNARNSEQLRTRFRDVTNSTLLGTGLIAAIQGVLVGAAFAVAGLPDAFFWGVVTAVFAILPVVGSGLVWGPGAVALVLGGNWAAGVAIFAWGLVVVASVDNVIRPLVYNKWAKIHPLVTLVGALAGIRFFGILGLLIGPLALSYFFEFIRMYREEYLEQEDREEDLEAPAGTPEADNSSEPPAVPA